MKKNERFISCTAGYIGQKGGGVRISREVKYRMGDIVVLRANPELTHIITGYIIRKRSIVYGISDGTEESWHQDIELEFTQKSHKVKGFKG